MTPDGAFAVVTDRKAHTLRLRGLRDGSSRVLLSGDATATFNGFRWSRDSSHLAFAWCFTPAPNGRCGGAKRPPEMALRIINRDGSGSRTVLPRSAGNIVPIDWAPDGTHILAQVGATLVVVSVADGATTEIKRKADIGTAAFSPDGRFVVYGNWQDAIAWGLTPFEPDVAARNNIYAIDVESGEERVLIEHPADEHFVGWTPSGRSLLFTSDRRGSIDLWMARFENGVIVGPAQRLADDVGAIDPIAVLRNGDLHFEAAERRSYSARVAWLDSALPIVSRSAFSRHGEHQGRVAFSPDGKQAAYLSGTHTLDTLVMTSLEQDTERRVRLQLPDSELATDVWFSPNGSVYLVTGRTLTASTKQLARVDLGTGTLAQLGAVGDEAVLWPDGESVAYLRGAPQRVLRRALDGTSETELFKAEADGRPRWLSISPDGTHLALFTGNVVDAGDVGRGEVLVVDVKTRAARRIAMPRFRWTATRRTTWSHDSKWVYYVDHPEGGPGEQLWRVSRDGGTAEKVLSDPCGIMGPAFHPSGKFLTYAAECIVPKGVYKLASVIPENELATVREPRR